MTINSSIFKLLGWYNFMYVVLLYLQRNLNFLDFVIGTWGIIGFICVNDQSYGQGMNLPDFRGSWKFWSGKFSGAKPLWIYKGMAVSPLGDLMLGIFWHISYNIKNWLSLSLCSYFIKIWWKSCIFSNNSSNIFYEILVFMQLSKSLDC